MKDSFSEGQKIKLSSTGGHIQGEKEGKNVSGRGDSPCRCPEAECARPSQGRESAGGAWAGGAQWGKIRLQGGGLMWIYILPCESRESV